MRGEERLRIVHANTRAPALSATCHAFRLSHWMHCSRPHISFVLASSKSQFFKDGQICTRIGGMAARLLILFFFFWEGGRGGAWMLPDDEHSLIMSNDEAHWTTVAIWKFKQHGWREPQSSSPHGMLLDQEVLDQVCARCSPEHKMARDVVGAHPLRGPDHQRCLGLVRAHAVARQTLRLRSRPALSVLTNHKLLERCNWLWTVKSTTARARGEQHVVVDTSRNITVTLATRHLAPDVLAQLIFQEMTSTVEPVGPFPSLLTK